MESLIRVFTHLPNALMLNHWLNMKNNCLRKKIKIGECPGIAYRFLRSWYKYQLLKKVFSLCHIYFSHNEHVPIRFWYTFIKRKLNLTKREKFLTSYLYHKHVCIVDKIDIDSGEDVELVEERTNEINDKTVYANQVQQSQLLARPGLLAGRCLFITIVNSEIFVRILIPQIMLKDLFAMLKNPWVEHDLPKSVKG